MFKVLRKIRKILIESASVRKYFLYAIGEIFLVVIGILIALEINNWNQDRIDHQNEMRILKSVGDEMNSFRWKIRSCDASVVPKSVVVSGDLRRGIAPQLLIFQRKRIRIRPGE